MIGDIACIPVISYVLLQINIIQSLLYFDVASPISAQHSKNRVEVDSTPISYKTYANSRRIIVLFMRGVNSNF